MIVMGEIKFKMKPTEERPERASEKRGDIAETWIVFDMSKQGLETVMKDYQVMAMRFLWERGEEGTISKDAWLHVNKLLMEKGRSLYRVVIISFLNDMVDAGVLNYIERTGKGGYHRVYFPAYDEEGFKRHVAKTIISKLSDMWPDATREALITSRVVGS